MLEFKVGDLVKSRRNNYYKILQRYKDKYNSWYRIENMSNGKKYSILAERSHLRHILVTNEFEKILFKK